MRRISGYGDTFSDAASKGKESGIDCGKLKINVKRLTRERGEHES